MVIEHAWLREVTWLNAGLTGADLKAFASYENIDDRRLRDDCKSGKLIADGAAVDVRRAFRALANTLSI
jgi:hypothetical protein